MIARLAVRTAMLSAVAALVIAAVYYTTYYTAYSVPAPLPKELRPEVRRLLFRKSGRRPLQPQPRDAVKFAGEILLIGAIALAGRKILRLRL